MLYNLRYDAPDFWSCVTIIEDTTKWFYTPISLPIIKVWIQTNTTPFLLELYNKEI